jgi:hypothetical protein
MPTRKPVEQQPDPKRIETLERKLKEVEAKNKQLTAQVEDYRLEQMERMADQEAAASVPDMPPQASLQECNTMAKLQAKKAKEAANKAVKE